MSEDKPQLTVNQAEKSADKATPQRPPAASAGQIDQAATSIATAHGVSDNDRATAGPGLLASTVQRTTQLASAAAASVVHTADAKLNKVERDVHRIVNGPESVGAGIVDVAKREATLALTPATVKPGWSANVSGAGSAAMAMAMGKVDEATKAGLRGCVSHGSQDRSSSVNICVSGNGKVQATASWSL